MNNKSDNKAKIKGLSFTKEYRREYEYLMKIKNASKYVCELIRRDLNLKEYKRKKIKKIRLKR